MKKKAADNGERDFETGLEKILRQHRFGDKNKGGGAPGEKNTRPKTNDEDQEIINLVENIDTVSRRAKKMQMTKICFIDCLREVN